MHLLLAKRLSVYILEAVRISPRMNGQTVNNVDLLFSGRGALSRSGASISPYSLSVVGMALPGQMANIRGPLLFVLF